MRSSKRILATWLALPALFAGVLLLLSTLAVGSAHGQEEGEAQAEVEDGYGYVQAVPDDAAGPSREEKEAAMEGARLAARLGEGWDDGDMLSDDLRLLISSARSQLETYAAELARLERERGGAGGELAGARERHAEAESRLNAFESAAGSLREAMIGLGQSFQQLGSAEARR